MAKADDGGDATAKDAKKDPPPAAAPGRTSGKPLGPTITVPRYPIYNPNDPLDPLRVATEQFTVSQVVIEARRIIRTVRPNSYDEYRPLILQLHDYAQEFHDFCLRAEFDFHSSALHLKDLQGLKVTKFEDAQILQKARDDLGEAWFSWRKLYSAYKTLRECYQTLTHSKTTPPPDLDAPPAKPPSLA
jgi:hypothetical protein